MFELNDEQVAYILEDIRRNGIKSEELQLSLLDHICCVIENEMLPDQNFYEYYRNVLPRFFKRDLREIQEETDLLLTFKNYYAMKKVMLYSGTFSTVTLIIGSVLKIMHWPGASVLLLSGIVTFCFLFLPLLSILRVREQKETKDKVVISIATFFAILISLATLFKVMHWPFANVMWSGSLAVLFFLFLPVYFFGGIRNPETKTNTIISSILILTAGGLLFTLTNLRASHATEEAVFNSDDQLLASTVFLSEQSADDSLNVNELKLKSMTDSLCLSIEKLKSGLIKSLSPDGLGMNEKEAIRTFGRYFDPVTDYLFKENGSAGEALRSIKQDVKNLELYVKSQFDLDTKELLSTKNIQREDYKQKNLLWEEFYFKNLPMEITIRNLNQLMLNIRIVEQRLIH